MQCESNAGQVVCESKENMLNQSAGAEVEKEMVNLMFQWIGHVAMHQSIKHPIALVPSSLGALKVKAQVGMSVRIATSICTQSTSIS